MLCFTLERPITFYPHPHENVMFSPKTLHHVLLPSPLDNLMVYPTSHYILPASVQLFMFYPKTSHYCLPRPPPPDNKGIMIFFTELLLTKEMQYSAVFCISALHFCAWVYYVLPHPTSTPTSKTEFCFTPKQISVLSLCHPTGITFRGKMDIIS